MLESSGQSDLESWRVLVLRANGAEALLAGGRPPFSLPSVEIPRWSRVAEHLTAAMKRDWGCEAVCAFPSLPFSINNCGTIRYQLVEFCKKTSTNIDDRAEWVPVSLLSPDDFQDADDYRALQQSLTECGKCATAAGPFARFGWFEEVRAWTTEVIEPFGLELEGSFWQFNASPTFNLMRFETSGPAVWFKAVGEPNVRELPVTLKLADCFPDFVPQIIAARPEWNAWLAWEAAGIPLRESQSFEHWKTAATALANMQIASYTDCPDLLESGARDLRSAAIPRLVQPFLETMAELMQEQPKIPPQTLSRHELLVLGEQIECALAMTADLAIPDCVGHLDLNPGNVIVSQDGCVFLDWVEAYVGLPFISFEYLLEHFRKTHDARPERETDLVASYCRRWGLCIPPDRLYQARGAAPLLAAFICATQIPLPDTKQRLDLRAAAYLRSLTRRMKYEADRLFIRKGVSA